MNKYLSILLVLTLSFFLFGCALNKTMRERFDKPKILTDSQGNKYFVSHNVGDTYSVVPIEDANLPDEIKDFVKSTKK